MASRACGNRLSLRNQYDTKTPRASTFSWAFRPLRPNLTTLAELNSRHEKMHSVGFKWTLKRSRVTPKVSVENFLEPGNRKNLPGLPNHRRTEAASSSKSLLNLPPASRGCKPSWGTGSRNASVLISAAALGMLPWLWMSRYRRQFTYGRSNE